VARVFGGSDFIEVHPTVKTHARDWEKVGGQRWERTDEWGNVWARLNPTSIGEVVKGAIDDIRQFNEYQPPDYSNPADYEVVRKSKAEHPDKWITGALPGFTFKIGQQLCKLDKYLIYLLTDPDLVRQLHDRIDLIIEKIIRNYASAGADSVMFWEDWGTQEQLLIRPNMWLEEFYPRFKKLFGIAHEVGLKVFMHSCGKITDIIPHLIEAGVDLFEFDQPELHGLDTLASYQREWGVTIWSPVDIQKILPTGDEKLIRAKAREMLDKLWRGEGGFFAGCYGDPVSIGLEPQWQEYACDEFIRYGVQETYR